jgi:hypothetical protein
MRKERIRGELDFEICEEPSEELNRGRYLMRFPLRFVKITTLQKT